MFPHGGCGRRNKSAFTIAQQHRDRAVQKVGGQQVQLPIAADIQHCHVDWTAPSQHRRRRRQSTGTIAQRNQRLPRRRRHHQVQLAVFVKIAALDIQRRVGQVQMPGLSKAAQPIAQQHIDGITRQAHRRNIELAVLVPVIDGQPRNINAPGARREVFWQLIAATDGPARQA